MVRLEECCTLGLAAAFALLGLATTSTSQPLNRFDLPGAVATAPVGPASIPRGCPLWLDADTPETGSRLQSEPLVTPFGTVSCPAVEINTSTDDPEALQAGASGQGFDIVNAPVSVAAMVFDFDVASVEFIYGGNGGSILVEARAADDALVASFYQASTYGGQPAGPQTLVGSGIRILRWEDPGNNYAVLDNVCITPESLPTAVEGLSWGRVKSSYR